MKDDLDPIWKALADPTRRKILDLLRDGPRQTSGIVSQFTELSRFAVMKHLDVLREAQLVQTHSEGRRRINTINVTPFRQILERWFGKFDALWSNTLLRVKGLAEAETVPDKSRNNSKKRA